MSNQPIFAPREVFEQILEYAVIPTFDLVVELPQGGVVLVWRKIAPHKDVWALPGLRMYKNETIEQTIERIAKQELGIEVATRQRTLLGQFVGKFTTEHNRQDLSTGYLVTTTAKEVHPNEEHFSKFKIITSEAEIPKQIGAMYKFYLKEFFKRKR